MWSSNGSSSLDPASLGSDPVGSAVHLQAGGRHPVTRLANGRIGFRACSEDYSTSQQGTAILDNPTEKLAGKPVNSGQGVQADLVTSATGFGGRRTQSLRMTSSPASAAKAAVKATSSVPKQQSAPTPRGGSEGGILSGISLPKFYRQKTVSGSSYSKDATSNNGQ